MKKRILIVDDEKFFVEPIKLILEKNGFDVLVAYDGMSGLKMARTQLPDLIMLDLMLPGISGYQVCRLLKFDEKYEHIPIIMVSAMDSERDYQLGQQTGADLYITKPIVPDRLLEEINSLIG